MEQRYRLDPFDPHGLDYAGKVNRWESAAYSSRKTTYNVVPSPDETGTYLAAFAPVSPTAKSSD